MQSLIKIYKTSKHFGQFNQFPEAVTLCNSRTIVSVKYLSFYCKFSITTAIPCPPPIHAEPTASLPPVRCSS